MLDSCRYVLLVNILNKEENYVCKITIRTEGESVQGSCGSIKNCSWTWMG